MEETTRNNFFSADSRVLLSLIIVTCTFWLFKFYWDNRRLIKMAALIPNCAASSKFDIGFSFIGKSINERFYLILEYFKKSPEVFKMWLGPFLIVGVSNPKHMEAVMNNTNSLEKGALLDFAKPFLGNGLLSAPVDTWKKHRKLISPSFNQKIINSFVPIFAEKCDILMENLEKVVGQKDVDILGQLSKCTLTTICETAMGLKMDHKANSSNFGELLEIGMHILMKRVFNVFYHSDIIFGMTPHKKTAEKIISQLNGFSQKIIAEKRAFFEQKRQGDYIEEEDKTMKTFLELLLEISHEGKQFTNQELQDEVNTFITAGSETSAVAMSFCCIMLGMHPEYQQKVFEEAIEVLGQDRYPDKEDFSKLKFTQMFIKETLRLFPIGPILVRVATGDIVIDDLVIPKDSIIALGVINSHRSPKYWKDPLKFNPYRFQHEEMAKKHPYSFLTFSGGPRNCIGYKYAMMFMTLILSKIVRKFEVKTDYKNIEEILVYIYVTLRPTNGFKISMELRE